MDDSNETEQNYYQQQHKKTNQLCKKQWIYAQNKANETKAQWDALDARKQIGPILQLPGLYVIPPGHIITV